MPVDQLSYGLPIREFLLVGLISAVVTLLLTGPVRMLALKVGAVAWPRGRDVHVTPTPRWGGLAMFGGVLAGLLLALQLPALRLAYFEGSTEVMGVVVATALLVGVGMLDDRYDLDAITKFAAQVTAGGLLVLYGVQWSAIWIPLGGGGTGVSGSYLILGQSQSVLLTVLLTVALVNAMNFVDGLDGLAGGIGMITTLATAVFCVGLISENGNDPATFVPALIAVVLAGACLGFLPHNFNPARIFMGDTGSMMVGVMLSAAITSASGRLNISESIGPGDIFGLISPVIVLVGIVFIPTLDLLLAVVRRTRAGASPFSPDKMHLHHRLLQVGHSHRRAVLLVYLWVAVFAFGAVTLTLVPQTWLVLAATAVGLMIAFVASAVPHRSRKRAAAAAAQASAVPAAGDAEPRDGGAAPDVPAPGPRSPDGPAARPTPDGGPAPSGAGRDGNGAVAPHAQRDGPRRRPDGTPPPGGVPSHRVGETPPPGVVPPHRVGETPPPGGVPPHRVGRTPPPGAGPPPRPVGPPRPVDGLPPPAGGPRPTPGEGAVPTTPGQAPPHRDGVGPPVPGRAPAAGPPHGAGAPGPVRPGGPPPARTGPGAAHEPPAPPVAGTRGRPAGPSRPAGPPQPPDQVPPAPGPAADGASPREGTRPAGAEQPTAPTSTRRDAADEPGA